MINSNQLKDLIERTLKKYDLYSETALILLIGTCFQESRGGTYLRQMSSNFDIDKHAIGIMQMEKNTFDWMLEKYGDQYQLNDVAFTELEYNLELSILFARLRYLVVPKSLPGRDDLEGIAKYWKKYYNTEYGSGTVQEFLHNYERYI